MNKGTAWVIGASSGLGLATAEAFAADGWLVVSGARRFGAPLPSTPAAGHLHTLPLDVTVPASRAAFVDAALAISPRVDALIYCAAVLVLGPCEHTGVQEYERVMQTNFLGLVSMVNAALPIMRAQGQGKLILFSSINGLLGIPYQSAYTASKHAMEGYAECLAMETARFGIQVCLVEPGDHRGGSQHTRLHAACADADNPYAASCQTALGVIHRDETGGLSPQMLGQKVVRNANRKRMRFRLRVAKPDQHLAVLLHKLLPARLNFRILTDYYGKGGNT